MTDKDILPPYAYVAEILTAANAYLGPAEAHGLLSGYACLCSDFPQDWLTVVVGDAHPKVMPKASAALVLLFKLSLQQLAEFGFEFDLLLPDDDSDLGDRIEALAQWCQGLLLGLELGRKQRSFKLSEDAASALDDIKEVAKAKQEDEPSEEAEQAYVELLEYIRMTVMMIFTELNAKGTQTYH